jgi:amino acid transporter
MAIAALLSVPVAYVYAELSSAFPIAGGEYCMVGRTMGPAAGFAVLGITVVGNMLGPAVLALGASTYLAPILPGLDARAVAIAIIAFATLSGILHIRTNAWVTGAFLVLELLALAALTALGFLHVARPLWEVALHPVSMNGSSLQPTSLAVIGLATSVAIYAFNGYGAACYFAEEMHEAPRVVARTILWALIITVVAELIPTVAVILGATDLKSLLTSQNAFGDFLRARGGETFNAIISLSVALAIINAVLALILQNGRFFYSTGRDNAWTSRVNALFTITHLRFHSPWVATLAAGLSAMAACFIGLEFLLVLTGAGFAITYIAVSIAALVGRWRGTSNHAAYRMPFFPWMPLMGLVALAYVIYASWLDPDVGRPGLMANLIVLVAALAYYFTFLRRRGEWVLRGPDDMPG